MQYLHAHSKDMPLLPVPRIFASGETVKEEHFGQSRFGLKLRSSASVELDVVCWAVVYGQVSQEANDM